MELPTVAQATALVDGVVRSAFNAAENWLLNHAGGPVGSFLEGALLLVRRSLFNQAPMVIPTVPSTGQDGLIHGQLGAVDFEGDALAYHVLENPTTGKLAVDAQGNWTFTPEPGYTGKDSFTVEVAPQKRSLDLVNIFADGSRTVTIDVGSRTEVDTPDIGVLLAGASGQLTVAGTFTGYRATVALSGVAPDTSWKWIDTSSQVGTISLGSLAADYWPVLQAKAADNGSAVNLIVSYTGVGGKQQAVLLQDVDITRDDAGQYVLSGELAANPEINPDGVDRWDVLGKNLKPAYDTFRTAYGIGQLWKSSDFSVDFTNADVFVDTLTPMSYLRAGMYAYDSEADPQAGGPGTDSAPASGVPDDATDTLDATALNNLASVTGSISDGSTAIITRSDGTVESWNEGERTLLNNPADGGFTSGVSKVVNYDQTIRDADGNQVYSNFTGYILGTRLTVTSLGVGSTVKIGSVITGAGVAPGTRITGYVDPSAGCINDKCDQSTTAVRVGNGYAGDYEVSIGQTVGGSVPQPSPEDPEVLLPAGLTMTQTGIPAIIPGVVVALADGKMLLRSPSSDQWITLRDTWPSGVSALITYREGLVVGLNNGAVMQWTGPGVSPDPGTWKNNWTQLHDTSWNNGVTALTSFRDLTGLCTGNCDNGFVVGLGSGSVQQYNDATGWKQLQGAGWGSPVRGIVLSRYDAAGSPTIAVGLQNGAVEQYTGSGWIEIERPDSVFGPRAITAMSQFGQNFIVGLKNSSVKMRVNPGPGTFVSVGGGAVTSVPVTVSLPNTYTQVDGYVESPALFGPTVPMRVFPKRAWDPGSFKGATVASARTPSSTVGTVVTYSGMSSSGGYRLPGGGFSPRVTAYNYEVAVDPGSVLPLNGKLILTQTGLPSQVQFAGGISSGFGNAIGNVLQMVVPNDWITAAATQSAPGTCALCSTLVNGTISGSGIGSATITDFLGVGYGPLGVTPNVATFRVGGTPQLVGAQTPGKTLLLTPTAGLNAATLVGQKVAGDGIPDGTVITGVVGTRLSGEIVYSVSQDVLVSKGSSVTTPDYYPDGKDSYWVDVHDAGWAGSNQVAVLQGAYQVNQIVPFKNAAIGNGVVVGLNNGSVQLWDGTLTAKSGQSHWTELHDAGWGSGVKTIALARVNATDANGVAGPQDGVVVGLANGATEQWTGVITASTGQNNWIELAGFYTTNSPAQILSAGYKSFGCATDGWKCFQGSNTLKKAVDFGATLAQTVQNNILYPPEWGTAGGVGGPLDPLFGPQNPSLREGAAASGTYHPFAINGLFNEGKTADFGKLITGTDFFKKLQVVYPDPLTMTGQILPATTAVAQGLISASPCAGDADCSVLIVKRVKDGKSWKTPVAAYDDPLQNNYWNNGLVAGKDDNGAELKTDSTIREYLGTVSKPDCLGGKCTVFRVAGLPQDTTTGDFNIAASPSIRAGVDVIPTIYGYTYIPDGFFPKFKPGNWSIGAMAAVKIGPSITVRLGPAGQIYGPEKDIPFFDFYTPGPLGFDSFVVESGVKLSTSLILNGAEKPSVKVYAYTVPGAVFTYNSAGAPGRFQIGVNNYLDINAADLYNITGISITATANPYLNLTYGIQVDNKIPVVGGWSLFKLGAGYENPVSATFCLDAKSNCTAGGTNQQANFYGVINDGSFDSRTAVDSSGTVLTVTQAAVLGAKPTIGQMLTGPGVKAGTTVTKYLGEDGNGNAQYTVEVCDRKTKVCAATAQSSVGGKSPGTHPFMTALTPGSDSSITLGVLGNLTFHAGVIETIVGQKLSYNAKVPLYNYNKTWSLA